MSNYTPELPDERDSYITTDSGRAREHDYLGAHAAAFAPLAYLLTREGADQDHSFFDCSCMNLREHTGQDCKYK